MATFDGYIRVSRIGDRAETLRSPEFQEREIRAEAKKRGLPVGEVIADLDESGGKEDRPGIQRAIERIERGESAGLIVAKLDRFSRDTRQAFTLAERIHNAGGRIYSYAEPSDWTTPDGELHVGMVMVIAQHQRRTANGAFEKSKARAIANGIPISPRIVPGYRQDPETKRLVIEPREAPIMGDFFRLRAHRSAGPAQLARFLESHDIRTGAGSAIWSKTSIYNLLRNRVYLGELSYGRKQRNGDGEFPAYLNPNSHEPIVDEATWLAAQPGQTVSLPPSERPGMLRGLVRCAGCRYVLKSMHEARHGRIYRCGKRHAAGVCPSPSFISGGAAVRLENEVEAAFWRIVDDLHATGRAKGGADLDALQRALGKADRALTTYRDDPDLDETITTIGRAAWRDGLKVRQERRDIAARELANTTASLPEIPDPKWLRAEWATMSVERRRDYMRLVIDCAVLERPNGAASLKSRVTIFERGTAPADLPRRGAVAGAIRPFDLPGGAGVSGGQVVSEGAS